MIHDFDLLRWLTGSEVAKTVGMMKVGDRKDYPDLYDDVLEELKAAGKELAE